RRREIRLIEALTELAERGLIFQLGPHPRLQEDKVPQKQKAELSELTTEIDDKEDELHELKKQNAIPESAAREGELEAKIEELKQKRDKRARYFQGDGERSHKMEQRRYALHRAMQRHIIKKMGAGPRDTMQINQFAPSLYASMPADLPRLNKESYDFLNGLIEHFSEYPDYPNGLPGPQHWYLRRAPINTRVQALRAALSIMRSTFSIAVVSRFEDYQADSEDPSALTPRGYFADYRVRVRWLIRKAFELLDDDTKAKRTYRPNSENFPQINALYIDEIVWLYNECGLVNFVQGNLKDASALILQAMALNRRVEGEMPGGPQYNRMALNLGIVTLERGRLDRAMTIFRSIEKSETQDGRAPGRVAHIAIGYQGLVHHLLGETKTALRRYHTAIETLRRYGDTRACAIFLRHSGDLNRAVNRRETANSLLAEALSFAQAGGHQDLENRCGLSILRAEYADAVARDEKPNLRAFFKRLDVIADYAKRMEMPSLSCDVLIAHSDMLIDDRETSQSGRLLSRAMTLAKRNGLELRLISALVRYAHVLALRGLDQQANRLLFDALGKAKRSRNQLELNAIDRVFNVLHER
ncbi:MAG: hypothetical protein AAFR27_05730, partial [Pseudomonadota bacterium]